MNRKLSRVTIFLMMLLFLAIPTRAMANTHSDAPLVIAVFQWAPYSGEELPKSGFAIEIVSHILHQAGYETSLTYTPWSRALNGIKTGRYQILPGAWYTDERNEYGAYTIPLAHNRLVIISHRKTGFVYEKPADLSGKHIGIARDYAYPDWFLGATYFTREPAKSLEQNLKKLIFGRIDYTLGDELVARYTAETQFGEASDIFVYSKKEVEKKGYHVIVSRQYPGFEQLVRVIDDGIAKLWRENKIETILKRHLRRMEGEVPSIGGS